MGEFGRRLAEAVSRRGPLCPGIDPHKELLRAWGLSTDSDGLAKFCDVCVAAFADFAVVKPQVAFFEAFGAAGFCGAGAHDRRVAGAGVLVLADVNAATSARRWRPTPTRGPVIHHWPRMR